MGGLFSFIGFLGVLVGGAAAAAGLYQTFGETQAALDAWVAGAQVFFLGAMLMALGSIAMRVRGTTRAVDDLSRTMRALRGELADLAEASADRAMHRAEEAPVPSLSSGPPRRSSRSVEPEMEQVRPRAEERDYRDPVLERRPARDHGAPDREPQISPTATRSARLGPARNEEPGLTRRPSRKRRSYEED